MLKNSCMAEVCNPAKINIKETKQNQSVHLNGIFAQILVKVCHQIFGKFGAPNTLEGI